MKECDKWGKAFLICDICIIVTAVFTLEWYLFNQPSIRIYDLSVADAVMKFFFPITDVCFLLLGISFFFYPTIFKSNKKLYLFITVLIGYALIDYTYTFFADNLPSYIIVSLRALYRVLLLCIAIGYDYSRYYKQNILLYYESRIRKATTYYLSLSCDYHFNWLYIKRKHSFSNSNYRKLYYFYLFVNSACACKNAK